MQKRKYLYLILALVTIAGCKIEDDYDTHLHPYERGLNVAISEDVIKPSSVRMLLYNNEELLIADTVVTVTDKDSVVKFMVPYGQYDLTTYDLQSTIESRKVEKLSEGYFFVPSQSKDGETDTTNRWIGDTHALIAHAHLVYTNEVPDEVHVIEVKDIAKRMNIRLTFLGADFTMDQLKSIKARLCGIASVLNNTDCNIMKGNPAQMDIHFFKTPPEGHPDVNEPKDNRLYASDFILGNDLETETGILTNNLELRIEIENYQEPIVLNIELSGILSEEKPVYTINIDIDWEEVAKHELGGSITIDEGWDEEIYYPI